VVAVEQLAQGHAKAGYDMLKGDAIGFPHRAAAAMLAPWAAADAGDGEASLVRPSVPGDRLVDYFGLVGRASLYERAKRYEEADADFKVVTVGDPGEMVVLAYGGFLERRGRRFDAVALYDRALVGQPGSLALE